MQRNDVIEVVTLLGSVICEVTPRSDEAAVLAGTSGMLAARSRIFHAAVRHLAWFESDAAPFVRRVEIAVISRDVEIVGVLCRNLALTSAARSALLTQDQDNAVIGEATKAILLDVTNLRSRPENCDFGSDAKRFADERRVVRPSSCETAFPS